MHATRNGAQRVPTMKRQDVRSVETLCSEEKFYSLSSRNIAGVSCNLQRGRPRISPHKCSWDNPRCRTDFHLSCGKKYHGYTYTSIGPCATKFRASANHGDKAACRPIENIMETSHSTP
eukprot:PhM_4_TR2448/c3_g1_i2/m.79193